MLTISYRSFQNSCALETSLSDFHNMAVTVENIFYKKEPKTACYRNHKNYSHDVFRQFLFKIFAKLQVCNEMPALQTYWAVCARALDKFTLKTRNI